MTAEGILSIARGELGVTESPAGSNRVKYNPAYYGRDVSGSSYPWCCAFLWWVFRQAGAAELFFGGNQTAYCPALLDFHKNQRVTNYQPGDIIFFNFNGRGNAAHVGLCEGWDGNRITTIDGNTGNNNEANGGAVMRRTRDKKYIVGAYRPAYSEEDIVTQEQFDAMLTAWLIRQEAKPASSWSRMAEAKAAGITDGTRPGSFATREEVATMIMAAR